MSATSAVYGPGGKVLRLPGQLEVVGHFQRDVTQWSILWTLVSLSPKNHDLSAALEGALRAAHGDAVVNLEVTTESHAALNALGILPFVPTVTTAHVEGDIVRVTGR